MRFKALLGAVMAMLTALAVVSASPAAASGDDDDHMSTYQVTFENLTGGQYFTPPNWAAHNRWSGIFHRRDPATPGLQALAENGDVGALATELTEMVDNEGDGTSGVGAAPGPIGPGESITFSITTSERRLSIASMIICTNDGFAGLDSRRLPRRDGRTRTYNLRGWDAGTEINTEAREDLVPAPFCGPGMGTGETNPALAQNGVVRRHRGIRGIGDLDPDVFGWTNPIVRVTVTKTS